jgi:hypothetical protein
VLSARLRAQDEAAAAEKERKKKEQEEVREETRKAKESVIVASVVTDENDASAANLAEHRTPPKQQKQRSERVRRAVGLIVAKGSSGGGLGAARVKCDLNASRSELQNDDDDDPQRIRADVEALVAQICQAQLQDSMAGQRATQQALEAQVRELTSSGAIQKGELAAQRGIIEVLTRNKFELEVQLRAANKAAAQPSDQRRNANANRTNQAVVLL